MSVILVLATVTEEATVHRLGGLYDRASVACGVQSPGEPRYVGTADNPSPRAAAAALAALGLRHRLCTRCFGGWA